MNFRKYISEAKDIKYKGLDKNMKGAKVSDDKNWDRIYTFDTFENYDKASRQITSLVAHDNIWKTDYDKDKLQIFIKFDK